MKMFFSCSWILELFEWTPFNSNPIDNFFQGLVGACGVSVLYNLLRVYYFVQTHSDSNTDKGSKQMLSSSGYSLRRNWKAAFQFWFLTFLLSLVGPRVCSLIVLEFSLRAISAWASARLDAGARGQDVLLVQCQFSLGCSLTCTLVFLHQGAPHSSLSLFLAAALSWALAAYSSSLLSHVVRLFPLHSSKHYCGRCISLLTSGHNLLASLQRAVVLAFAVGTVASSATVFHHFLSHKDAIKFWTPLTLCYTMLVVYTQEDQKGPETLLHTVVLRLGGLLVLMMTMGNWSDVLHILITFLGEAACLMPAQDLLQAVLKEEEETTLRTDEDKSSHNSSSRRKFLNDSCASTNCL